MKSLKTLIIALACGIGMSGLAQETTSKQTPEQRQEKYLAHLTKELSLDAKQQEAVGKILADKSAKLEDFKSKKEAQKESGQKMTMQEKQALKSKLKAEKANTENQMKAILSADQYTKWLALRAENKEKFKEKRAEKKEQM